MNKSKITQLALNLSFAGLYVLFCMVVLRFILPDGSITTQFLIRGSKLVFISFIAISFIFFSSWFLNKEFKFKKQIHFPELKDFFLLALPMSPVLDYIFSNTEYLDMFGLFYIFGTTLVFSLIFCFILPIPFSYVVSYKTIMISGIAFSFTILSLAKISNNPNDHILNSQFVTQGIYLIISFLLIYLLYFFNKKVAYTLIIFFVLSGIIINLSNNFLNNSNKYQAETFDNLRKFLENKNNNIVKKKNIYILVYESYAGLETINHYGFDNSNQMNFLKDNGFKNYHGIYSVGSLSIDSTSRLLEINGNLSKHGRHYTSGNAFGLDIFKANNYKTIGLFKSSYFFGSSPINWDEFYPKSNIKKLGGKTITKTIFEGEFRFDIFDDFYDYDKYLKLKEKFLKSKKKQPTLFYTHNNYPGHSTNIGKCSSNEKELYFEGLKKANVEMKNDITNILENDSQSIIVLLSDHGPYLTKNCRELRNYEVSTIDKYDLQDRYGTLLSIYWPEDITNVDENIVITQDIFPAILSNITNNKSLFNELKLERRFFDRFENISNGINVINGIIDSGKDKGEPLFEKRTYNLTN